MIKGQREELKYPINPDMSIKKSLNKIIQQFFLYLTEIQAAEAMKWLREAGFPQYAQMYQGI